MSLSTVPALEYEAPSKPLRCTSFRFVCAMNDEPMIPVMIFALAFGEDRKHMDGGDKQTWRQKLDGPPKFLWKKFFSGSRTGMSQTRAPPQKRGWLFVSFQNHEKTTGCPQKSHIYGIKGTRITRALPGECPCPRSLPIRPEISGRQRPSENPRARGKASTSAGAFFLAFLAERDMFFFGLLRVPVLVMKGLPFGTRPFQEEIDLTGTFPKVPWWEG